MHLLEEILNYLHHYAVFFLSPFYFESFNETYDFPPHSPRLSFCRVCQSFLPSKDVRRFCILSNFVVNSSYIYFPICLAASQIECRTFSPSQYIMFWICKAVLGTIWMVSMALNNNSYNNYSSFQWVRLVKSLVAAHRQYGGQTVLCSGFLCYCQSLVQTVCHISLLSQPSPLATFVTILVVWYLPLLLY